MTVFVVNRTHDDISAAKQYGDVRYINQHYITADRVENEELPPMFRRNMEEAADDFDPDRDYLLIVGDHLQLLAFSSMLAHYFKFYRVLRWDRQAQGYYPVIIREPARDDD